MNSFQLKPAVLTHAFAAFAFLAAAPAKAADVRIVDVKVTNDSSIPSRTLVLNVDPHGDLQGLKIYTAGQGITSDYKADEFRTKSIVLFQTEPDLLAPNGREIIKLDARLVTPDKGGPVRMSYAVNALTGNFDSIDLDLDRDESGHWAVKQGNDTVRAIDIVKGSLGIKEIEFR